MPKPTTPHPRLLLLLTLGLLLPFLLTHACTSKPQCTGDKDCQQKLSGDYLCLRAQCVLRSTIDSGTPENKPQPEATQPETKPQPETTQPENNAQPETTPRDNKPQPDEGGTPDIGAQKLHQPCLTGSSLAPNQRCGPGFVCVRLDSLNAFCFQDCGTNPSVCATNQDGRNHCLQIAWSKDNTPISICTKLVTKDQRCEPRQSTYCTPNPNDHLVCKNGRCVAGKLCQTGSCSCGLALNPPTECDVSKRLYCGNFGRCIVAIPSFEGEICTTNSNPARPCIKDHFCVSFGQESYIPSICLKSCDTQDPLTTCSHRPGFACQALQNNNGACFQNKCDTQQDCAFTNPRHLCAGSSATSRLCVPMPEAGSVAFGKLCNDENSNQRCQRPFVCLRTSAGSNGYCSSQCKSDEDCSGYDRNAKCNLRNGAGIRSCGWSCPLGSECPSPLICRNQLCIPPQ